MYLGYSHAMQVLAGDYGCQLPHKLMNIIVNLVGDHAHSYLLANKCYRWRPFRNGWKRESSFSKSMRFPSTTLNTFA